MFKNNNNFTPNPKGNVSVQNKKNKTKNHEI